MSLTSGTENELLNLFAEKGITCKTKILDLVLLAESKAKNTSDFMSIARFYKELDETEKIKTKFTEKQSFNFSDFRDPNYKFSQTIETETNRNKDA